MKAAELRIGNWYYSMTIGGHWIESQVKDGKHLDVLDGCSIDEAKPIPLTEKWLERFGFEKVADNCWLNEKTSFYVDNRKSHVRNGFVYYLREDSNEFIPIDHVHQLQNLYFALTGQELTLTK